jgi:N-acetylneuraminate synthase
MKFGVVYYWRDPVDIFDLAEDFLELRVFESDIKNNYSIWKTKLDELKKYWDEAITIHMPEYFNHPETDEVMLVDLSSTDVKMKKWSLDVIKSLIAFANSVEASKLLVHPGGISEQQEDIEHNKKVEQLKDSLIEIYNMEFNGEILLENMPWFYWRKDKKRWYSSICIQPDDFSILLDYCDGMVLDISHGFLSNSKGTNKNLENFARRFRDKIDYLHVSDGLPPDNEGLQIGEGNINFEGIFNLLDKDKLWLVPEIWKGHENFGEGFQIALERIKDLI